MDKSTAHYIKMTETPVPRLVTALAIPTIISMLVTNIYNLADTYFVGQLGGNAESGAIGIVFGFMSIVQAVGFMFGQGAGSIVARRLGAKDNEKASITGSTAFAVTFIIGVLITIFGLLFRTPLLHVLGSSDTIFPYAEKYITCIIIAAPFTMASFALNNILRYEGKAAKAMIGLCTGSIINIAIDPLLMFVFDLGILGAGIATAFSQILGFFILLYFFVSGQTETKLNRESVHFSFGVIWEIATTGLPSFMRQGLTSISTMLLNNIAVQYDDEAVAAMSIVNRLAFFMFAVGLGMGQGYQPVCAFNYGAKRYDRVKKAFIFTLIAAEIMLGTTALIGFMLSGTVVGWFRDDPRVIEIGSKALKYASLALLTMPLSVMANMTFQSTGLRVRATFTSMLRSGLVFIPLLIYLEKVYGIWGIQVAQPFADVVSFIIVAPLIIYFIRNLGGNISDDSVK